MSEWCLESSASMHFFIYHAPWSRKKMVIFTENASFNELRPQILVEVTLGLSSNYDFEKMIPNKYDKCHISH